MALHNLPWLPLKRQAFKVLMDVTSVGETLMLLARGVKPQRQGARAQSRLMPTA